MESLLDSPAYLTHATEAYRMLLLPEADTDAQLRGLTPTFEAWLRKKIAEEVGYDQIVREVLTVRLGSAGRRAGIAQDPRAEPSPLAYYVAKDAKPENLAAGTARTFLGIRLECAQCHNHPFDQWKREEFWGLAAFFAGVSKQGKDECSRSRSARSPTAASWRSPRPSRSSKPRSSTPRSRSGAVGPPGASVLADWVTAPDNPYFARAAVNRVWARFFGTGIIDPVDDMRDDNPPSHPELLDLLARSSGRTATTRSS